MRSRNERFHDRVAGRYDAVYDDDPYHDFVREISQRHLRPFLPQDLASRILDAGCGTGHFGLRLARSGFAVDFLDLSRGMLDQARARAAEAGLAREPRFFHGDLSDVDTLTGGGYALMIAQGDILSFVERPERALRAVRDALIPGGVFFASVDQRCAGFEHFLERGDLDGLTRFVKDGNTVWLGGTREERFPTHMFTAEDLRRRVEGAGFSLESLIGRPVLALRRHRKLLEDKDARRRLLALEEKVHKLQSALGLASHLEFVARRVDGAGQSSAASAASAASAGKSDAA